MAPSGDTILQTEMVDRPPAYYARKISEPRFPTWTQLKWLRGSRVVRSMHLWLVIVPVLAKLTSKLEPPVNLVVFGTVVPLDLRLPFSWQLFYFSAIAFSIGNLVFLVCAPRIVRDHNHPGEFHQSGKGFDQLDHYRRNAGMTTTEMQGHVSDAHEQIKSVTTRYNRLFWIVYDYGNVSRSTWRYTAAGFYVAGLGLLGYVLIENFVAVVGLLAAQ